MTRILRRLFTRFLFFFPTDRRVSYGRRPFRAPEKLQIVKPIKGSVTLHQWKKLANPTLNLAETRPGVHVKGEGPDAQEKEPRERKESSDLDVDEYEEDEPLYMNLPRTSESTSEAASQTGTEDGDEDDKPIQMRVSHGLEKGTTSQKKEETMAGKGSSKKTSQQLGLISLVSGQGFQGGFKERGGDSGSILTHLLNSPSSTSSGTSSVGKVLADVLSKASKEASEKEPSRAESLRNLANYFSEKERGNSTAQSQVKSPTSPPPVVPFTSTLPSSGGGMLLSKILGTSGLSAGLTIPAPITTTAKTSGLPSTTSSTSTTPSVLTRSTLVRNSSGSNLLNLAQGVMVEDASNKRHSLDSSQLLKKSNNSESESSSGLDFSELKFPTLRRRASSGDLQEMGSLSSFDQFGSGGLGARLKRSSSIGNMKDLSNESLAGSSGDASEGGFFNRLRRTPSIGSLTSLVQRSNFSVGFSNSLAGSKQRSTSLDALPVFKPGESPPSPSKFDQDGGHFFGKNAPSSSVDAIPGATGGFFGGGTKLSSLAGVRGFWSQGGSKSLDSPAAPVQAPPPKSEERLEKINNAFAFEDFGGLGLMSFFGGKSRGSRSDSQ